MDSKSANEEIKQQILKNLETGVFEFGYEDANGKIHSLDRMVERNVTEQDIRCAARNYIVCFKQSGIRWELQGTDLDGDKLTVIVSYDGQTTIVTVF